MMVIVGRTGKLYMHNVLVECLALKVLQGDALFGDGHSQGAGEL